MNWHRQRMAASHASKRGNPRFIVHLASVALLILALQAPSAYARPFRVEHASLAEADTVKWSAPLNISKTSTKSWLPSAIADRAGNVHVVWAEWANLQSETSDTVYYTMRNGQQWAKPSAIAVTGGGAASMAWNAVWHPVIAADDFGRLHLAWTDTHSVYYSRAYISGDTWKAQSWSKPRVIFPNPGSEGKFPTILVDAQGTIHLAFNTLKDSHYMQSADGGITWSAATVIGEIPNRATRPRLLVDDRGLIHAGISEVNSTDNGIEVVYSRSSDNGRTWDVSQELNGGTGAHYPVGITVGMDGKGVLHAVWASWEDRVFYDRWSTNRGLTWSDAKIIARGQAGYGWSSMATDSAGTLHLLLSVAGEIYHYQWTGSDWTTPENISRTATSSNMPTLLITGGNQLHAIWMEYTVDQNGVGDLGNTEIYYSTATVSTPAIQPTGFLTAPSIATPASTASPTSLQPTRMRTPTRTSVSSEFPSVNANNLETSQGIPIFAGILPIGLLLAAIASLRVWGRRL